MNDNASQRRITSNKILVQKLQQDFNTNYFLFLFAWGIACLFLSKPINLIVSKSGAFLFSSDQDSIVVYQWSAIVILFSYFAVRLLFFRRLLWGQFPILKIANPIIIWYVININEWVKPLMSFVTLPQFLSINLLSFVYYFYLVDVFFMVIYYLTEVTPRINKSSFVTDLAYNPKDKAQKELLGFSSFADHIVEEIETVSSSESIVYGINGEWGEGKTSMINMISTRLKEKDYVVVDFHPWKTNSGIAVNQLFFDVLKEGLKSKMVGINWKIDRYADALLQLDRTGIGKTLRQLFVKPNSIEKQKKKLGNSLKMLNNNLVVVVDDLDRLAKNEIVDVLKLMRDTANFPNIVFLAAYDRNYINSAVKEEINGYNYENYMEKIVLWEAPIFRPQPRKYIEILKNILTEKLPEFKENINEIFDENNSKSLKSIYDYGRNKNQHTKYQINIETPYEIHSAIFTNLRTVKKFANYLTFNIKIVRDSVVFKDFYYLYLLRYFYPHFFDLFISAYHELYRIKNTGPDRIKTEIENYETYIFKKDETKGDEKQILIVKAILSNIIDPSVTISSKSLTYYRNFLNYFHLGNHDDITMSEFSGMLKSEDFNDFKFKVQKILKMGSIIEQFSDFSIVAAVRENSQLNDTKSFILYFKSLIWLAIKYDKTEFYQTCHSSMDRSFDHSIYDIQTNQIQINLKEFILNEELQLDFQYFLYLIIQRVKPSLAERKTYLGIDDVIELAQNNFCNYISSGNEITPQLINLFYCSYQSIKGDKFIDNKKVIQKMKKKALEEPQNFIKFIVVRDGNIKHSSNPDNYNYRFINFLLKIFIRYDELISFLKNTDFGNESDRAALYLKYLGKSFPDKKIAIPHPFLPEDADYRNMFAGLDSLDILLDWKLREKIDGMMPHK